MSLEHSVREHFNAAAATVTATSEVLSNRIVEATSLAIETLEASGKILICGNGGSASDAQHLAAELVCRYERERKPLPAIALTADNAILTAAGNDYDFSQIFSRQIQALGCRGDLLVAITTSGNSANVNQAVECAIDMEMKIVALTGKDGGQLALTMGNSGLELRVPSVVTARIQEVHGIIIHCICDLIELHTIRNLML